MASVLLTTTVGADEWGTYRALLASAEADPFGAHYLTEDAEEADIILFAETGWGNEWLTQARAHPYTRRHREKVFCQCELDNAVPFLPGVYTSVPDRWYRPDRVRTGPYLVMYHNEYVEYRAGEWAPQWLYSFVGDAETHAVREGVLRLDHPRGFVRDTVGWREAGHAEKAARYGSYKAEYAELSRNSKFILCPRGVSPSTVRVYETMKAGRVPVIVADDWIPPAGPAWDTFSVRVPEAEVASIPERLERIEQDAEEMGKRARESWSEWFSSEVAFHRTVEWCLDIRRTRRRPEALLRFWGICQSMSPKHALDHARRTASAARTRARRRLGTHSG